MPRGRVACDRVARGGAGHRHRLRSFGPASRTSCSPTNIPLAELTVTDCPPAATAGLGNRLSRQRDPAGLADFLLQQFGRAAHAGVHLRAIPDRVLRVGHLQERVVTVPEMINMIVVATSSSGSEKPASDPRLGARRVPAVNASRSP